MNELQVFSELHKFISGLDRMGMTLAAKSLTLGYKPILFGRSYSKFATLYGEKRYNCLILHVEPGNKDSVKGKMIQKEIQQLLHFDIAEMRSFALKKNEVFIPFEVIDTKDKLQHLKDFVSEQFKNFIKR
jgi:hypothetical protein